MTKDFDPRDQSLRVASLADKPCRLGCQPGVVTSGLRTSPVSASHQRSKMKQGSEYMYRNVVSIIAVLCLSLSIKQLI